MRIVFLEFAAIQAESLRQASPVIGALLFAAFAVLLLGRFLQLRFREKNVLRESERKLRSVLDSMYVFVGLLTPEGVLIEVNRASVEAAGLTHAEVIGKLFWETYWWSYSPEAQEQMRTVIRRVAAGETVRDNFRVRMRDDQYITVDGTFGPLYDEAGRVTQLVGSAVDVTESTLAKESQLKREQLLSEAQLIAHVGNWELNILTGRVHWSDEVFRIFGEEPGAFTVTYPEFLRRVHPEDRESVIRKIAAAREHESRYELTHRITLPDRSIRMVHEQCIVERNASGEAVRMAGTTQDITESWQQSNVANLYQKLLEQTADQVMITDRDGIIQFVNETFLRETGWRREEVIGNTPNILRSGKHPAGFYRALWETLLSGQTFKADFVNRRKDHSLFYEEKLIKPVFDDSGVITHFISTGVNIAARVEAEKKLQAAQSRYQDLVGHLPDALIVDNEAGNIVYSNPAFYRLFGYAANEAVQLAIEDYVAPEYRQLLRDRHDRRASGETMDSHFEYEAIRKDGSRFWAEVTVAPVLTEAGLIGTQSLIRDITEQRASKEREINLQRSIAAAAREWQGTFDSVTASILILDVGCCIRRVNHPAHQLIGLEYSNLIGMSLDKLAGQEPWNTLLRSLQGEWSNHFNVNADDIPQGRHWSISISRVSGGIEYPSGVVVVLHELTDWVRMQDKVQRGELLATLGRLVGGVAHEARNPLFAITATIDAWEREPFHSPSDDEYLEVLRRELQRLRRLMEDLLEYGKPQKLDRHPVSPGELLSEATRQCEAIAAGRLVTIVFTAPAPEVQLQADRRRIIDALRNLIENAIQHAPETSEIRVFCSTAVCSGGQPGVEFIVEDEGPGFRAEDLRQIFEPFFTRRAGGTGLGLAVVQRIAEHHHGSVSAENRAEGGGRTRLLIPVDSAKMVSRDD
jgi:PAS domain S-box-containing protein